MRFLSNAHTHSTFCDGKNPPEEETLRELERLDIPAWETADGNVYAVSDGKTVRMRQGR